MGLGGISGAKGGIAAQLHQMVKVHGGHCKPAARGASRAKVGQKRDPRRRRDLGRPKDPPVRAWNVVAYPAVQPDLSRCRA
ncbi:hypothetical protein GCM10008024_02710 [Allgaiera indica]|uniref:Uncharacterized protein n=1 Tax=Allgaiera indica TaxID=765699 RepID=A0AAN4UN13_9RHOB|nr:hypothetical protein GCM10008024_02710 [Allgaiera indica]